MAWPKGQRKKKGASDADALVNAVLDQSEPSETEREGEAKISARIHGRDYDASPTIRRFQESDAFVRFIRGPVGGGKTTGCCQEIMRRAREQKPNSEGIRRTRWAIIRNTYGMLKDTSAKTWLEWYPEDWFGKFNRTQGDMKHHIKLGDIDCEILFRALDTPEDIKKVLSLELTGAFCNEVRELPKEIIDALTDRVGRFPAMRDGGPTWRGIIGDTNPPDEDHWFFEMEKSPPPGWDFFVQPGGLIRKDERWVPNPEAENSVNLEANYYATRSAGKREDYIRVYYGNEFGFVSEGKPVFPEYSDAVHSAKADIVFMPGRPIYVGVGIDLHSGAIFAQKRDNGQWIFLDEFMPEFGGMVHFSEQLAQKMASEYPGGTRFRVYTVKPDDLYGAEAEAVQVLRGRGIVASPCRIHDATLRREAVAGALSRLTAGEPGLLISPSCKITRKALSGGYAYGRIQGREEKYHDEPSRNRYAVLAEAAQYILVGGGEAQYVFRAQKPKKLEYKDTGTYV